MRTSQGFGLLMLLLVSTVYADRAHAQNYPSKPLRIHTSGAGANPDFVSRLLAREFTDAMGQPVIVENKPQGVVLATGVAKSPPDGYTLMVAGDSMWTGTLFAALPYDAIRDFATITTLTRSPNILVVHPSLPVNSVSDLIRLAKAKPGTLNYSAGATGSSGHMAMEQFKYLSGIDVVRVSYKDQAQQNADTLSGRTPMTIGNVATWIGMVKSGGLRAVALGGSSRSTVYPDLPIIAETLPGYQAETLLGFFAPAKTPDAIISRLNQETTRILQKPEVRQQFQPTGQEAVGGPPQQLAETIKGQLEKVAKLIKDAGIKND